MIRAAVISASLLFAGAAQPAFADWGGVAVNNGTLNWGYSAGWKTKRQASDRAMHYCRQFSNGQPGCQVVLVTRKCGAVVRANSNSNPQFFVAGGSTEAAAHTKALGQCKEAYGSSCDVRKLFCADDL